MGLGVLSVVAASWRCCLGRNVGLCSGFRGCVRSVVGARSDPMSASGAPKTGCIRVVCGCMFSGKSRWLAERARAAVDAGLRVEAYKHASDHRYAADAIATHDGQHWPATAVDDPQAIGAAPADVVLIDEAQFFPDNLIDACQRLREQGVEVCVAGLDLDSWGLPFERLAVLQQRADEVIRLFAQCAKCGGKANRTQRVTPVTRGEMVAGRDAYEARCDMCFEAPPARLRC